MSVIVYVARKNGRNKLSHETCPNLPNWPQIQY